MPNEPFHPTYEEKYQQLSAFQKALVAFYKPMSNDHANFKYMEAWNNALRFAGTDMKEFMDYDQYRFCKQNGLPWEPSK